MGMTRVQFAPISFAVALAIAVAVVSLLILSVLLVRGLRRSRATRFGAANVITTLRGALVAAVTGMVVASFVRPMPVSLLVPLIVVALLLDGVDGWVARRTNSSSELGARFDMEVDAFLLLVLSVYVSRMLGPWVLAIGLMRYAFVAAGFVFPWLRRQLPFRYWRKVVTAAQGIALTFAATGLVPVLAIVLVAIALALLVESFGRDVIWLAVTRRQPESVDAGSARS
jgi:phosphatidylglycerophosphate synthase